MKTIARCGTATLILALAGCTGSAHPPSPVPPRAAAASTPATTGSPVPAPAGPVFDPANFGTVVDNPYYPLTPGMKWVYEGVRDGVAQRDEVVVTDRTKVVDGVTAIVETDVATDRAGVLLEKTEDWYAQDRDGNVWYVGEATATYTDGQVDSTEGSWTAGVDGAVPGIIMPAHPQVTQAYRQEYYRGQAEDTSWVVQDGLTVKVPYGSVSNAIRTLEFTRLEPDVIDTKFYAPGVGIVREASVAGPKETADLVSFTGP